MKPPLESPRRSPRFRLFLLSTFVVMLAIPAALAQENVDQQSEAYQASMTQGDVQRDATAIKAELIELRNQMRQLMPDDVATVDKAIKKMETLSEGEMDKAVKALQDASRSKDAKGQVTKISEAMQSQGAVSNDLKKLAVDLKMRETLASMGSELSALVLRQVAVNSEIKRLGAVQQLPKDLHNQHEERYQVANEDQKGVSADLKLLGKRIDTLSQDITDDTKNGLVQAAEVAKAQNLDELSDKAANLTANGPFADAAAAQVQVIQALVAMEQALAGTGDQLERVRGFAERLKRAGGDQKTIVDAVMLIGERQDLERDFKQMQSNLNDDVIAVQYEIQPVNSQVAGFLAPASDASNKAIENFRRMWEEHMDARVNTQDSLKYITAAHDGASPLIHDHPRHLIRQDRDRFDLLHHGDDTTTFVVIQLYRDTRSIDGLSTDSSAFHRG